MSTTTLTPLDCLSCDQTIPAQPEEVAWVCAICGSACRLTEDHELIEISVHYSDLIQPNTKGKPYWVIQGRVDVEERTSDSGTPPLNEQWEEDRVFIAPAFQTTLEELINISTALSADPPELPSGSRAAMKPVVFRPEDLPALVEFLVLEREATRQDKLKELVFDIKLSQPELWILPH